MASYPLLSTDMADMARVLISYHYGGVYIDLDFYCYRPLRCLLDHVHQALSKEVGNSESSTPPKHVLLVAREPLAHAVVFRNKTRVVIQVLRSYLHSPLLQAPSLIALHCIATAVTPSLLSGFLHGDSKAPVLSVDAGRPPETISGRAVSDQGTF